MFYMGPLLTVLGKSVPWLHTGSHGMGVLSNSFAVQSKMLFSLFRIFFKKLSIMDFLVKEALMNALKIKSQKPEVCKFSEM